MELIFERIQEILALSSKAAANEQRVLNGKFVNVEQLCQKLLHSIATQLGTMRALEVRLNEVSPLVASTAALQKTAAAVKERLDKLDEYLSQVQR